MNRRIKIVWLLSIGTMIVILCMQGYWLVNQYRYATGLHIEKLKTDCAKAIEDEEQRRYGMAEARSAKKLKTNVMINVNLDNGKKKENGNGKTVTTEMTYELPGKKRTVKLKNLELADGFDLTKRYTAWNAKPMDKRCLDSLLTAAGNDTARDFRFYKSEECLIHPEFSTGGLFGNRLDVIYSANPLEKIAVAFSIAVRPSRMLKSMAWQLAGSAVMVFILCFCLTYQLKTIMIQKRIDRIRHEFMKNIIYEMKQPPTVEPTENEAVNIGEIAFFYSLNELRHGADKVIITSRQAEILRILAERKNEVVSREHLLTEVWGDDSYANSMALNVQITYLRRALKVDPNVNIEAVIKKGYVLKTP